MKLILVVSLLVFAGCSGAPLMRCDAPVSDPAVMSCPEQVQGQYRKCEKPVDVYQGCVKPQ